MALMPDEQYVMISDSIEKKKIAHSSHNRKTHCGKGGRVKFPSDYLSKKELKAMNGEVKSYNLNRPMTWEEFRSMPQDLQIMYIKKLRNEFGVPDIVLSKAMGICKSSFSKAMRDLNLSLGKSAGATGKQWLHSEKSSKFSEYWNKFSNKKAAEENDVSDELIHYGTKYHSGRYTYGSEDEDDTVEDEVVEDNDINEDVEGVKETDISKAFAQIGTYVTEGITKGISKHDDSSTKITNDPVTIPEPSKNYCLAHDLDEYAVSSTNDPGHIAIPTGGRLSFDCKFDDAVKVLESILSGTNVRLNVDWVVVKGD